MKVPASCQRFLKCKLKSLTWKVLFQFNLILSSVNVPFVCQVQIERLPSAEDVQEQMSALRSTIDTQTDELTTVRHFCSTQKLFIILYCSSQI